MARGDFRERSRESQKKKKDRDERKKRATELTILRESQRYKSGDPMSKRRERHLKSKLNIGDKPLEIKDHLGRDSSVGVANRAKVRGDKDTPNISEEDLLKVRKQVEQNKAKEESGEVKKTGPLVTAKEGDKKTPTPKPSRKERRDKKNFPGGKEGYTRQEKAGARQSSARNSVARQAYLRKKAKLKIKKGE